MSRPRGNGVQRRLISAAGEVFEAAGWAWEADFSQRGGHQRLLATPPGGEPRAVTIVGTPRNEDTARVRLICNCKRLIRTLSPTPTPECDRRAG